MNHKQPRVLTEDFELSDNRLLRQLQHSFRIRRLICTRTAPTPRLKQYVVLFLYHKLGRTLFGLRAWAGRQKQRVKTGIDD